MTKGKEKVLMIGDQTVKEVAENAVAFAFDNINEGEIAVEGGMREAKTELFKSIREDILEIAKQDHSDYRSADKRTTDAALSLARKMAEKEWKEFVKEMKEAKKANLS